MNWYKIPIFHDESGADTLYVPGVGELGSVTRASISGSSFVLQAHNPKANPTEALLGLAEEVVAPPDGWEAQTLVEAQAYFEDVVGRPPTNSEVY